MVRFATGFALFLSAALFVGACGSGGQTTRSSPPSDSSASIVARVAGTPISLAIFEAEYAESVGGRDSARADSAAAYRTFLEQYVNYRLKVQAARDAGYDTLASVQKEAAAYRATAAAPRLMRQEVYEPLVRTLYERRQQAVEVSHILVRVAPDAPPSDTMQAYRTLQSIADSLDRGASFAALAYRNSDDPSARKEGARGYRGRLGYIQAGQIVAPFEKRMYALPPGSVSGVFRTQYGYHLLKVHDKRAAQPPIQLAHIMLRPEGDSTQVRRRLDSIRTAIQTGSVSFAQAAQRYSQDQQSASEGGSLGRIESPQSLPPAFRQGVASIRGVGGLSDIVRSRFGYHILKLTGRDKRPSYEEAYDTLKKQIEGQPRVEQRKAQFARQVRREVGASVDTTALLRVANIASLDTVGRPLLSVLNRSSDRTRAVATLGDSSYTIGQLGRHTMQVDGGARQPIGSILNDFLQKKAFEYAQGRLERRSPSFKATMQEYRDGLILFRYMQDSVWTAAARDTAALRQYYRDHQQQYRAPSRVRTLLLRAPSDTLLAPYPPAQPDTTVLGNIVGRAEQDSLVRVDTAMVTRDAPEAYRPALTMEDGAAHGPIDESGDALLLLRDRRLSPRSTPFSEARSRVIQDYRDHYEQEMMDRLRQRYQVATYPSRLQHAFSDAPHTTDAP
jgi:peptidyl-prolyl cis-trans isomerase SurA